MGGKCCRNWSLPLATIRNLRVSNFSKDSNLDDLDTSSLPVFQWRTNLKLYNISGTLKLVKKVITNLDLSRTFGLHCVLLFNCSVCV